MPLDGISAMLSGDMIVTTRISIQISSRSLEQVEAFLAYGSMALYGAMVKDLGAF